MTVTGAEAYAGVVVERCVSVVLVRGYAARARPTMVDVRRAMRLRTQLVLLQSAIMLVVILGSGIAAAWLQERGF